MRLNDLKDLTSELKNLTSKLKQESNPRLRLELFQSLRKVFKQIQTLESAE
ncbi:MAG: hypothetical protein AB8E15_12425 [Bdellovibrionales bacterium]